MEKIMALKDETIFETKLKSGLKVAIHPKPEFYNILVSFQVDFGGADLNFEVGGKEINIPAGVAHFLEHLLFHNRNVDLPEFFAENSADINAYTSKSITAYKFKTRNNIETLLNVFLSNFSEFDVPEKIIEKERKIIKHELMMSDDSVHFDMHQKLNRMLYSDYSIYSDVGGTISDIRKIDFDVLKLAFDTFYHPENVSLVITGNVDPEKILSIIENHNYNNLNWPKFNQIKNIIKDDKRKIHHQTKYVANALQPMISFAVKIPRKYFIVENKEYLHIVIGTIISNAFGMGSHNFDYLEKQKLMNVSFFTKLVLEKEYGYFNIYIQTNKVRRYQKTITELLLKIASNPLDEEFFTVNKKNIIGNYITLFDSISRSHEILCNCVNENIRIDQYLQHILDLNMEDLDSLRHIFNPENIYSLTYLKPKKN